MPLDETYRPAKPPYWPGWLASLASCGAGAGLQLCGPYFGSDLDVVVLGLSCCATVLGLLLFSTRFAAFCLLLLPMALAGRIAVLRQDELPPPVVLAMDFLQLPLVLYMGWHYCALTRRQQRLGRERCQLVAALQAERATAQRQAASKASLLSAASHQLRQPMHALSLYLGALAGLHEPGPVRDSLLAHTRQSAQQLESLFQTLLEIGRLDAGAVRAEPQELQAGAALARAASAVNLRMGPQRQHLRLARCRALVQADPALLARLLGILLENALAHAGPCEVLLGCRRRGRRIVVQVIDNGRGIAPHWHAALLDGFHGEAGAGTQPGARLGLGLPVAQRLAALHGGSLALRSQAGRGSCFSFDLPLAAPRMAPSPCAVPAAALRGSLVVAVDDDPFCLELLAALLEGGGCTVIAAASTAAALEQLADLPRVPDFIVADYWLLGETGLETIEALRDEYNHAIPALLASGRADSGRLALAGFPVLRKPLREAELLEALCLLRASLNYNAH